MNGGLWRGETEGAISPVGLFQPNSAGWHDLSREFISLSTGGPLLTCGENFALSFGTSRVKIDALSGMAFLESFALGAEWVVRWWIESRSPAGAQRLWLVKGTNCVLY